MTRPQVTYVCESAATAEQWQQGRRDVEQFDTYQEAWERANEHLLAGRRAFPSETIALPVGVGR